ncbi:helix-turn-helix transcriptional regulator [Terasakiella pusilla]|uniref:helix-turn-helix transcriptional regulator n=1 Tax=Terasakiella pusilla TaxID=64973 RepID=UPI00048DB128|nr:hypothetical protein [Terasakiella pusilla]
MIERMLSVKEAARRCGVSDTTFDKLVNRKIAPQPVHHPDVKRRLWDIQEIDRYLDRVSGKGISKSPSMDLFRERLANATKS